MAFSPQEVLLAARADPHYLGHDNAVGRFAWVPAPDAQSELLVPAGEAGDAVEDDLELAVLKMIVQLNGDKFFLTPDGHFNPDRLTSWQARRGALENLITGRGSVVAGAAPQLTHPLYHAEYSVYTDNLLAIFQAVLPCVTKSGFPIRETGRVLFKFVHGWFDKRSAEELEGFTPVSDTESSNDEEPGVETNGFNHSQINLEELDSDREPPFRTINVPVQPRNYPVLLEAAKTHSFNPLCVYMRGHRESPLRPAEYGTVLPGAIAQVTFTLSHKLLKRPGNTVSHFAATIDEIEVIDRPVKVSLTPSKANNRAMFRKRGPGSDEPSSSSKRIRTA